MTIQQIGELEVFRRFAEVCPSPLLLNTVEQPLPPAPDLLCQLQDGSSLAFELTQAEDFIGKKRRKGKVRPITAQELERTGGSFRMPVTPLAIVRRVREKLGKPYESDCPIHLLAWSMTASVDEREVWLEKLQRRIERHGPEPFQRIWVFGYAASSIVWDSGDLSSC